MGDDGVAVFVDVDWSGLSIVDLLHRHGAAIHGVVKRFNIVDVDTILSRRATCHWLVKMELAATHVTHIWVGKITLKRLQNNKLRPLHLILQLIQLNQTNDLRLLLQVVKIYELDWLGGEHFLILL